MKKLQFKVNIDAPVTRVYDCMLGISSKSTYEQWTSMFNPTSTYEGKWDKGTKIRFVGVDEKGEKGGMVSRIVENIPNRFVSIQHYGHFKGDNEITEGPEVEKWGNGFENYTFEETNAPSSSGSGGRPDDQAGRRTSAVTVDLDSADEYVDYMNQTYPKALDKLKEICEQ